MERFEKIRNCQQRSCSIWKYIYIFFPQYNNYSKGNNFCSSFANLRQLLKVQLLPNLHLIIINNSYNIWGNQGLSICIFVKPRDLMESCWPLCGPELEYHRLCNSIEFSFLRLPVTKPEIQVLEICAHNTNEKELNFFTLLNFLKESI